MKKVFLYNEDIADHCLRCPLLNTKEDECMVQSQEANEKADTWEDLKANCPVQSIEEHDFQNWLVMQIVNRAYEKGKNEAEWLLDDTIYSAGQILYVKDLHKIKVGNGKDKYVSLPFITEEVINFESKNKT